MIRIFTKLFPSHLVWISRSITLQDKKLSLTTKESFHNALSRSTISKYWMYERGPKAFRGELGSLLLTFFLFCLRSCSMGTNPLKVENIGFFCIRQMQSRCVTLHWNVWISSTYGLCQMWSCILLCAMVCAGKSALFASGVSLFPPLHLLSFGWRSCFAVTNIRIRSEESKLGAPFDRCK